MNFESLPLEIRYKILSLLPTYSLQNAENVSKDWNKIVNDPFFHRSITIGNKSALEIAIILGEKYRRLRSLCLHRNNNCESWVTNLPEILNLRRLVLTECQFNSTETLSKLCQCLPCLQQFSISACKFDEFNSTSLIENCKLLKDLSISRHDHYNQNHTCTDLFLQNCRNIEILALSCPCVSDFMFETVIHNLSGCVQIMEVGCSSLAAYSYLTLRRCHQLTALYLTSAFQLTDEGLLAIRELKQLQCLIIDSSISDLSRLLQGQSFPKLTILDLESWPNLQSDNIELIAESCVVLQDLTLCNCLNNLDDGICTIVRKCKALRQLELRALKMTTGNFLREIAMHVPNLTYLGVQATGTNLITRSELLQLNDQRPEIDICDFGSDRE